MQSPLPLWHMPKPMTLFAHRGASGYAPENSFTAFALALEQQVDGIELDVREVAGQAMVMHDATLSRTTNGQGHVHQLTKDTWQALDAGDGKAPPNLVEVLALVAGQCDVNIELKCLKAVQPVVRAIKAVVAQGLFTPQQLCVSSFHHVSLLAIKAALPKHPVAPLIGAQLLDYAACAEPLAAQAIHSHVETTDQVLVNDAHARGLQIRVYTVTDADDLLRMQALGVDAVFVNDVPWARQVLGL